MASSSKKRAPQAWHLKCRSRLTHRPSSSRQSSTVRTILCAPSAADHPLRTIRCGPSAADHPRGATFRTRERLRRRRFFSRRRGHGKRRPLSLSGFALLYRYQKARAVPKNGPASYPRRSIEELWQIILLWGLCVNGFSQKCSSVEWAHLDGATCLRAPPLCRDPLVFPTPGQEAPHPSLSPRRGNPLSLRFSYPIPPSPGGAAFLSPLPGEREG